VTWPDEPVVALAYLDQLIRARPELNETSAALYEILRLAKEKISAGASDSTLADALENWASAGALSGATSLQDALRVIGSRLADTAVPPPSNLVSQAMH